MKKLLLTKPELVELLLLFLLITIIFIFRPSFVEVVLLSLGYVWNWTASSGENSRLSNPRYRLSFYKLVFALTHLFQRLFRKWPRWIRFLAKLLPAGLFWSLVTFFVQADVPVWIVFLGSLVFEVFHLILTLFASRTKEVVK